MALGDPRLLLDVAAIGAVLTAARAAGRRGALPGWASAALSVWSIAALAGATVALPDGMLADWRIHPFLDDGEALYLLRYDQAVRLGFAVVIAMGAWRILRANAPPSAPSVALAIAAALLALGLEAMRQVLVFAADLALSPRAFAGYETAMLDLAVTAAGAAAGAAVARGFETFAAPRDPDSRAGSRR